MNGLTNFASGDGPASDRRISDAIGAPQSSAATPEAASLASAGYPNADEGVDPNPDSWRAEVAARLERYRTRRKPRTPRYPSLLLPFDAPESWSRSASPSASGLVVTATALAVQDFALQTFGGRTGTDLDEVHPLPPGEARQLQHEQALEPAKVIEFPRSAAIPIFHRSELADPVLDLERPRIVEAPEILPPPPALGGMLIEPALPASSERQADLASIVSASIPRRSLAALVDGAVLMTSLAFFVTVFFRLNPSLRLNPELLPARATLMLFGGALGVVTILLWAAYQFLFVVYSGTTLGLRAAGLRLAAFDGSQLNRRSRRWRVLASFLSALSAGLGYFWCVLDQNGLCWHDRITRSHICTAKPDLG